jgi:hypothetical protein
VIFCFASRRGSPLTQLRHPRVATGDDGEAIAGGDPVKHHWGTKAPLSTSNQSFFACFWLAWVPAVLPARLTRRRGDDASGESRATLSARVPGSRV